MVSKFQWIKPPTYSTQTQSKLPLPTKEEIATTYYFLPRKGWTWSKRFKMVKLWKRQMRSPNSSRSLRTSKVSFKQILKRGCYIPGLSGSRDSRITSTTVLIWHCTKLAKTNQLTTRPCPWAQKITIGHLPRRANWR